MSKENAFAEVPDRLESHAEGTVLAEQGGDRVEPFGAHCDDRGHAIERDSLAATGRFSLVKARVRSFPEFLKGDTAGRGDPAAERYPPGPWPPSIHAPAR